MKIPWKKLVLWSCSTLAAAYLVSFAVLAHFGGYTMVPSGAIIAPGGYAINDTMLWQPRFGTYIRCHFEDTDFLGLLYSPLIRLHQRFFRPTIPMSRGKTLPSRAELHPDFLGQLDEVEKMAGHKWEEVREAARAVSR